MTSCTRPRCDDRPQPRNHGERTDVIVRAAAALGVQPSTVRDWVSGHHQLVARLAVILQCLAAAGCRDRVERLLAPLDAIRRGMAAPALSDGLLEQEKTAEGDEDVALVAFLRHPEARTARPLVRELDTERTLNLELRQAIAAEYAL